ncbi:hypothetical protein ACFL0J_05055, partial [Candidatus Neomarinimicrobiota bacterium]
IAKNLICWAIIIHYEKSSGKLKKIKLENNPNQEGLESLLRLIYQQSKYFKIDVDIKNYDEKYKFKANWVSGITKSIETDTQEMINELNRIGINDVKDFQFYQTVSNNITQIRFKGYQIGKWNKSKKNFTSENQNSKSCEMINSSSDSFVDWANWLREKRSMIGKCFYDLKAEHYMESCILDLMDKNSFYVGKEQIFKVFKKAKVNFQFPALLYGDNSTIKNTPKYIDILGKTNTDRPVFLELKVYKPNGSSRGQYLFEAISQVICYCNYYRQLRKQNNSNLAKLPELFALEWEYPILVVVVNDIGSDPTAEKFRDYIKLIEKYFQNNISFEFVELDCDAWQRREVKLKLK